MRSPPLAEAWAAEAMRDESALMHDEAAVPQECIMSSITGVMLMLSPGRGGGGVGGAARRRAARLCAQPVSPTPKSTSPPTT